MGLRLAIRSAIGARRCLFLTYRNYSRVVEPYAYGVVSGGGEVLCAYQLSGGDETHLPTGWKAFDVRAIGGVRVLADGFSGERTPVAGAWGLVRVRCEVSGGPGLAEGGAVTYVDDPPAATTAGRQRRAAPPHTG